MAFGYSSSKEYNRSAWTHWLIPSIADLIFLVFVILLSFTGMTARLLGDAGIGWHIRTGQWILANHAIPRVDVFSSTMSGQPWFAWEWLYDLLVGGLERAAGLNGVVLLTAFAIAFTFSWTFLNLLRRGTNFLPALVLILIAASASMIHFLARPHVLSWMFTVLWFSLLESAENGELRLRLWMLPALMIVWVNLHGGFLLGFVLLGIFWIGALWQTWRRNEGRFEAVLEENRAGKRALQLSLVGAVSGLATLVNPYGWHLHAHIYRYLSNRFLMDHIDEFQSPNFHGAAQKCFAALLMLSVLTLAVRQRGTGRVGFTQILIVLFAISSGLYASRNLPTSSLLLILVIGPTLSRAGLDLKQELLGRTGMLGSDDRSASFLHRMQSIETTRRGHLWPCLGLLLALWIASHGGMLGSKALINAHFSAEKFPVGAVDYLEANNLPGPIFAPDLWGGYLIFRLYPRQKTILDDRHDLYGDEFFKSYLTFMRADSGWKQFLEQHPAGCMVLPKHSAGASLLAESPSWRTVYRDEVAIVFLPGAAETLRSSPELQNSSH